MREVRVPGPEYLLDCLDVVRERWLNSQRVILFLDFDGTLATIAPLPGLARLLPEMLGILQTLALDKQLVLVFISGRSVQDLKHMLKLEGVIYAGNHGLEISGPALDFVHSGTTETSAALTRVCRTLNKRLVSMKGVHVENKNLTASIHYRIASAADSGQVRSIVEEAIKPLRQRLRITEGKCVFELRPDVDWNKGTAARFILRQLRKKNTAAIYLGDDRTDEDAFRALPGGLTIFVGREVAGTAARYFVKSPEGVYGFLAYLHLVRTSLPIQRK